MSPKSLATAFGLAAATALSGCAIGVNPYGQISVTPANVYTTPYYRAPQPRVYIAPPAPRYYTPAPRYYVPAPIYVQPRQRYYQHQPRHYGPRYGW